MAGEISQFDIFGLNATELKQKLFDWGLIPQSISCGKCGAPMNLRVDSSRVDKLRWVCNNRISGIGQRSRLCGAKKEFRSGTFFAKSKLPIKTILLFANLWVRKNSLKSIQIALKITKKTAVDWSSFCREVLVLAFMANPIKLGGIGKTVEIDESKFGKVKYHRGHPVDGQWVFGGFERESGFVFMEAVEKRDAATLLPIIERRIEKGTTIISDCWKAYDNLNNIGYHHLTVNHSETFKDPITGANTNSIESAWRHAKDVAVSNGRKKAHIPGNLAKYMFLRACNIRHIDPVLEFFRLAGSVYNPNNPDNRESAVDSVANVADPDEFDSDDEYFP